MPSTLTLDVERGLDADRFLLQPAANFFVKLNAGNFFGVPNLVWVGPDRFLYDPIPGKEFGFQRANGDKVIPQKMYTNGGSIPKLVQPLPDLSPWTYGAAFLIHDWEFEAHHLGKSDKSFEEVNKTLAEGIKTLMDAKICRNNPFALYTIWAGVSSGVAKAIWDGQMA
ncbi:MAG: hypothetical protein HQL40_16555 [Alphaproteobacteria bacterium]|nr:hypothetical protein [Alphaproteobacteria bacterium]